MQHGEDGTGPSLGADAVIDYMREDFAERPSL